MKNKEIENKIKKAYKNAAPDILEDVLRDCNTGKGVSLAMTQKKNKNSAVKWIAAVAASLAVLIAGVGFYGYYDNHIAEATAISLDVNPSVEISLNKNEKVLKVTPLNEDGKKILGQMDFRNTDLEVTVNALVGSMVKNGYVSDLANSILISVEGKNQEKAAHIQQELTEDIQKLLAKEGVDGAILSQLILDKAAEELADEYEISLGKAQFIAAIAAENPRYSLTELAKMTVHELNLLADKTGTEVKNVQTAGDVSKKAYITAQEAEKAALAHAGLKDVTELESELELEHGILVYEVEFSAAGLEYDVYVDARDGKIVKSVSEPEDDTIPKGEYISRDQAIDAALKHTGLNRADIRDLEWDMENEDGVILYEVEFISGDKEYEVLVDAVKGSIVEAESEKADSDDEDDDEDIPEGNYLSEEKAKEIALNHAGVQAQNAENVECELENEDGVILWEVEFDSAGYEYEYEIDAVNGTVLHSEKEID